MTAASPMIEKVARAICLVTRRDADAVVGIHAEGGEPFHAWEEFVGEAKAALRASQTEEMRIALRNLLAAIGGLPVLILTEPLVEAVEVSRHLLTKIERSATEQPA